MTTSSVPLVTVCVPSIGRTQFLPAVRDALHAQTLGDFEVVVLDNDSGVEAQAFFADWMRVDARVRVARVAPRIPMFENFERGRALARGRYFAFCHDDDIYGPRWLAAHVAALERSGAGFAGSNWDFVDERGSVTERRRWVRRDEILPGKEFILTLMRRGRNIVPMPGLVFRREALEPLGFDPSLSCHYGDFVILMRLAERGAVALLADPLMSVRRHSGQASVGMALHDEIPLRSAMMSAYIAEYRSRWSQDSRLAEELVTAREHADVVALTWGWLTARDRVEANACASALAELTSRADVPSRSVAWLLRHAPAFGLRVRGDRLRAFLRTAANSFGV